HIRKGSHAAMFTVFRFRRLALPLLVVLGLLGWSGYWVYAQARAEQEVDQQVALLQARGGEFVCQNRQWQGFPLRLELTCADARLDLPDGPVIETEGIEATSHLYDPRRIIARSDGFIVEGAPDWSLDGRNVDVTATVEQADRFAFSASVEDLSFADGRMPAIAVDGLEIEGRAANLPRRPASDLRAFLREAARLGSEVTIDRFEARMADIRFTATGTVELGPEGPTGSLSTTVSDYKAFLADLERRGVVSRKVVGASAMMIGLLQGKKTDGEMTLALRFHEGKVFWGPFAVAEIPPLE
ncbi:MAG: DUF2125 domain-containing protein, partial [Hyphomicrobiales bacterium]